MKSTFCPFTFVYFRFEEYVPGEWGVLDAGFGGAPGGVPGCTPVAFWWTIGGFAAGTPWGTAGAKKYFFQIQKCV